MRSVAEDAGRANPSPLNSLLTGKNTENSAPSAAPSRGKSMSTSGLALRAALL
jgi:hypothetical protein